MSKQGVYDFYRDRILSCPRYGFKSGEELLSVVVHTASLDSELTPEEFNSIIISAVKCREKLLEDNYNAGWQDQ